MRLNQKRALFSLITPSAIMVLCGIWIFSSSWFVSSLGRSVDQTGSLWTRFDALIQKFVIVFGAFGTVAIPLGVVAAAVFWYLDRQERKS